MNCFFSGGVLRRLLHGQGQGRDPEVEAGLDGAAVCACGGVGVEVEAQGLFSDRRGDWDRAWLSSPSSFMIQYDGDVPALPDGGGNHGDGLFPGQCPLLAGGHVLYGIDSAAQLILA